MAWVKLDDGYDDHPKIVAAGLDAAWLNTRAILWCNRNHTDGHVPQGAADKAGSQFPARKRHDLIRRLVRENVWHEPGHGCAKCRPLMEGYLIHDYLDYQPSRAEIETRESHLSAVRAEAGRKGARARWQTNSKVDGNGMAQPWHGDSKLMPPVPGSRIPCETQDLASQFSTSKPVNEVLSGVERAIDVRSAVLREES